MKTKKNLTEKNLTEAEIMKALNELQEVCDTVKTFQVVDVSRMRKLGVILKETLDLLNLKNAEIEELQSDISMLKLSNINLQDLYETEREKVKKAKENVIGIAKSLQTAKAEIEMMAKDRYLYTSDGKIEHLPRTDLDKIRAEAIKEFAEKVKEYSYHELGSRDEVVTVERIYQIAKEMGVEL